MLRADLHLHTRFSFDATLKLERLLEICSRKGLNCIAVTDHHTIRGAVQFQEMAPFRVIVGEEIKTSQGEVIGLFLQEEIPRGLSPLETVRRIKAQGGLVSIPHPFDRVRRGVITKKGLDEILPYADIVEAFNARNVFDRDNRRAREMASQENLLVSAVSDSHTPFEPGDTYVEMPEFDGTAQDFKRALVSASLICHKTTPLIHVISTTVRIKRRLLGG